MAQREGHKSNVAGEPTELPPARVGEGAIAAMMVALGLVVRTVLIAVTPGNAYDMASFVAVRGDLGADWWHVYSNANTTPPGHWPYPPLLLGPLYLLGEVSSAMGISLTRSVRMFDVAADCLLAVCVYFLLRRDPRVKPIARLAAVGAVALGPVLITASGAQGQIDSLAVLPGMVAMLVWRRAGATLPSPWLIGVLVGIGGGIKTVPLILALAFAAAYPRWRERVKVLATALAVPLVALLPFLTADHVGVLRGLRYNGLPGLGGLSLLAQPSLGTAWIHTFVFDKSSATRVLQVMSLPLLAVAVVAATVVLARRRVDPIDGACALWAVVLVAGVNFGFGYLVWLVPFLAASGRARAAIAVQLTCIGPQILAISGPWKQLAIAHVYVAVMIVTYCIAVLATVQLVARLRPRGDVVPDDRYFRWA